VTDLGEALGLQRGHERHGPYIGPRDKSPLARPRHHDRPRRFCLQLEQSLPDLLDHLPVQGVQFLLAVDGQDGDVVLTFYLHIIHMPPFGRRISAGQHFS
jgi:hypothetical protein